MQICVIYHIPLSVSLIELHWSTGYSQVTGAWDFVMAMVCISGASVCISMKVNGQMIFLTEKAPRCLAMALHTR